MITVNPQGLVYLCKTPLENDYKNQLTFANATAQLNYFNSKVVKSFDNYTYIRKDNTIKVGVNIDEIINCNYLFYQNKGFTTKYYYCFITDMTYVNENCTLITIETDVYQTWYFDINYKACFVEREHVNNDAVGLHTVPEGLETGEYISCKLQPSFYAQPETCFVVATSWDMNKSWTYINQDLPTGLYYIGVTTVQGIQDIIELHDDAGKGEAVDSVFVALKDFFYQWHTDSDITGQISTNVSFDYSTSTTITKVNYLGNDYIPKNNKLLTFPYSFLQVSNHSGQVVTYKWENFNLLQTGDANEIRFNIKGTLTPGGSMKAFPLNYNNILNNYDDSINIGKYPIGAFTSDVYTNWLTQNGVNIAGHTLDAKELGYAKSTAQLLTGGLLFGQGDSEGGAMIGSGIRGIFDTMQENYRHSLVPDSINGNVACGDINYTLGLTNLEFKRMSIKNEYAIIIDKYFSMFGYKVNDVKIPNITGRANWNYVKTIDCNFEGDIPQEDLNKIKNMFNAGVTLWHNPTTMYDYTANNGIV